MIKKRLDTQLKLAVLNSQRGGINVPLKIGISVGISVGGFFIMALASIPLWFMLQSNKVLSNALQAKDKMVESLVALNETKNSAIHLMTMENGELRHQLLVFINQSEQRHKTRSVRTVEDYLRLEKLYGTGGPSDGKQ